MTYLFGDRAVLSRPCHLSMFVLVENIQGSVPVGLRVARLRFRVTAVDRPNEVSERSAAAAIANLSRSITVRSGDVAAQRAFRRSSGDRRGGGQQDRRPTEICQVPLSFRQPNCSSGSSVASLDIQHNLLAHQNQQAAFS